MMRNAFVIVVRPLVACEDGFIDSGRQPAESVMSNLAGRTWFITGTSAGFGKAVAREVLARGGNVVASARSLAGVSDVVAIAPERVLAAKLDVTHPDEIATSVAAAIERFGAIDALVNNAGYGFLSAVEEA